jgi:hypothetical protein
MNEKRFITAGWLAVSGAVLVLPVLLCGIVIDIMFQKGNQSIPFAAVFLLVSLSQSALVIFAFYRFKAYLNELHNFHKTDFLMIAIVIGGIAITSVATIARVASWAGNPGDTQFVFIALFLLIGIPLGVLSVIFGIKLLELNDSGMAFMKPYAYLNIVSGVLLVTFFLAPIAFLVGGVADLLMGLMMLRIGPEKHPEFV